MYIYSVQCMYVQKKYIYWPSSDNIHKGRAVEYVHALGRKYAQTKLYYCPTYRIRNLTDDRII